jgi:hypothetical protein
MGVDERQSSFTVGPCDPIQAAGQLLSEQPIQRVHHAPPDNTQHLTTLEVKPDLRISS